MSGYDDASYNYTFLVTNGLYGPAIAATVGLEVIAGITANLLVLILTFCNHRVLKQPSVIFLTNLAVANLQFCTSTVAAYAVTAGCGEWVFGETEEQKIITCQFEGFMKASNLLITTFALTFISFDKFLFVTKALFYKKYQKKTWIAVVASVSSWIISGIVCAAPLIGFGMYVFDTNTGTCSHGDGYMRVVLFLLVFSCFLVIISTTLWTFRFTFNFINRIHSQAASTNNDPNHVYNRRVKKVFGIFGTLLAVSSLVYLPLGSHAITRITLGEDNVPASFPIVGFMLYFLGAGLNPVIQLYFRHDLRESFKKLCCSR